MYTVYIDTNWRLSIFRLKDRYKLFMKIKMLNKIEELNAVNQELFNRKAELGKEITSIDIAIFEIVKKYRKYIEELIEE